MDECECLPLPTDCHLLTFSSSYGQCRLPLSSYSHTLSSSSNFLFFFWSLSSSCECHSLPTQCHLPITSSSSRGHSVVFLWVSSSSHTLPSSYNLFLFSWTLSSSCERLPLLAHTLCCPPPPAYSLRIPSFSREQISFSFHDSSHVLFHTQS